MLEPALRTTDNMNIGTCRYQQDEYLCVIENQTALLPMLDPSHRLPEYQSVLALIDGGPEAWDRLRDWLDGAQDNTRVALSDVELLAPIPMPRQNIMCLGWNYREHIQESAEASVDEAELPDHPVVFTKSVSSVNGPYSDIPYDAAVSEEIDWEVELGVVIGVPAHKVSRNQALAHVFGYTVINDISARDLQFRHKQFFIGKSLTACCPMGPWITTADDIADPQDLNLSCLVNGDCKQSSNTRYMIFDVPTIIETLSTGMVLWSGDIIATGTPSGVGFTRQPAEFLTPGDVVECMVDGVGTIRNRIAG